MVSHVRSPFDLLPDPTRRCGKATVGPLRRRPPGRQAPAKWPARLLVPCEPPEIRAPGAEIQSTCFKPCPGEHRADWRPAAIQGNGAVRYKRSGTIDRRSRRVGGMVFPAIFLNWTRAGVPPAGGLPHESCTPLRRRVLPFLQLLSVQPIEIGRMDALEHRSQ